MPKKLIEKKIKEAISALKDFQLETVEYLYDQMFENGKNKMLVADEVGLGKTIVAKGLIAKAFQRHINNTSKNEFHVIYICSNQALAAQNLKKLNLFRHDIKSIGRLIYLSYKPKPVMYKFRLSSLTPGTSFYLTGGSGQAEERLILFTLLSHNIYFRLRKKIGLQYLLKGTIRNFQGWQESTINFQREKKHTLRDNSFKQFKTKIKETVLKQPDQQTLFQELKITSDEISLWKVIKLFSNKLRPNNYTNFPSRHTVVGLLRQALTEVCLSYLKADLFILDEFQRYNNLIQIDQQSPEIKLARQVFEIEDAKVLMLSATPFKPYTNPLDISSGEDHYTEFNRVLRFLMQDENEQFWQNYANDRKAFFHFLRRPKQAVRELSAAVETKRRLEDVYFNAMVRTERIIVSDNHNTMVDDRLKKSFTVKVQDIKNSIQIDKVAQGLKRILSDENVYNPIEYSKSAPFPLSFMDGYELKNMLQNNKYRTDIKKILKANPDCWIDFRKVNHFKSLMKSGLPNGKLRYLLEDNLYSNGWKLLWVPPTIPYYEPYRAYKDIDNFSKTLVFSSWALVPRMIASLVSYESERLTIGKKAAFGGKETLPDYFSKGKAKRRPHPQLVFTRRQSDQGASNMTNFCLLYPSPTLAKIYHPKQNITEKKSIRDIRNFIRQEIKKRIRKYDLHQFENTNLREDPRWYWAAPLLLDKLCENAREVVDEWIYLKDLPGDSNTDPEAEQDTVEEKNSECEHFYELYEVFVKPVKAGLGKMPKNLEYVMTDMVLGSPAIAAYRSLDGLFDSPDDVIKGALIIAKGFMSLFNKPESIATVRLTTPSSPYWRRVLRYATGGNIQAMIDEFVFLLFECENFKQSAINLAQHFTDVMNIRTSNIKIDSLNSFLNGNRKRNMRCHFALNFGNQKIETASGNKRSISLREAFNSPFKPFILASTSIGQEGLDFHYYCRKVMHWNLPNNAIDIEQREGRVNRYMGHAIRKNIALKYLNDLDNPLIKLWETLFEIASQKERANQKCDLVPYWHIECDDGVKIERIIPLHPFSKDIGKRDYLLKVLMYYRLTFGQPRQEELVDALIKDGLNEKEINELISELLINLSPIRKNREIR